MFNRPEIMRLSQELAGHASARQAEIARNVANADTPGYRARDVADFQSFYKARIDGGSLRATRPGHLAGHETGSGPATVIDARSQASPNGNSVALETEMIRQAETRQQHELALAVYKSSLDLMRVALGRGR